MIIGGAMRALVVDDSRATRRVIGEIIRELGYDVTEAGNGCAGLERLAQRGRTLGQLEKDGHGRCGQ